MGKGEEECVGEVFVMKEGCGLQSSSAGMGLLVGNAVSCSSVMNILLWAIT